MLGIERKYKKKRSVVIYILDWALEGLGTSLFMLIILVMRLVLL